MHFAHDEAFYDFGEALKTRDLQKALCCPAFIGGVHNGERTVLTFLFEELASITKLAFGVSTDNIEATPAVVKGAVACLTNTSPQVAAQLASSRPFLRQINEFISAQTVTRNVATVFCLILDVLIEISNGFVLVHFPERTKLFEKLVNHIDILSVYEFLYRITYNGRQYMTDYLTLVDATNILLNHLGTESTSDERILICLSNIISVSVRKTKLTEPFKKLEVLEQILGFCWNSGRESVSIAAFRLLTCLFNHSYETGSDSDLIKNVLVHVEALCNYVKSGEKFTKSRAMGVLILIRVLVFKTGGLPECVFDLLSNLLERFCRETHHTFVHSSFYELLKVAITKDQGLVKKLQLKEKIMDLYQRRNRILASYWGFLHRIAGLIVRWRGFEGYEVEGWEKFVQEVYYWDEQIYLRQYGGVMPGVKSRDEIVFDNFPSFRKSESSDDEAFQLKPIVSQPQFAKINLIQAEPIAITGDMDDEEESEYDYEDFESEVQQPEVQGGLVKWIVQKLIPDERITVATKLEVTDVLAADFVAEKLLFGPNNDRIALTCQRKVEVFELNEREVLLFAKAFKARITAAAFIDTNTMAFILEGDSCMTFVDLDTGNVKSVELVKADYAVFSYDGTKLACAVGNETRVYDTATREVLATFSDPHHVTSFCSFSPNGEYLGICYRSGQIHVFCVKDGTRIIDVKPMQSVASSIVVGNDGTTFVTGSSDTTVTIWELADNTLQWRTLRGHKGSISALAMDDAQQWVISGGQDSNINLSSMESEEMVYSVSAHTGFVSALACGHKSPIFASASEDYLVKIWKMEPVSSP